MAPLTVRFFARQWTVDEVRRAARFTPKEGQQVVAANAVRTYGWVGLAMAFVALFLVTLFAGPLFSEWGHVAALSAMAGVAYFAAFTGWGSSLGWTLSWFYTKRLDDRFRAGDVRADGFPQGLLGRICRPSNAELLWGVVGALIFTPGTYASLVVN